MTKDLTLSIIVPEKKIKRSLPVAIADIDSHFYSLRYKSYEIVIVGDQESRGEDMIQGFGQVIPNLSFRESEDWHKGLRGENVLIVNSDSGIDLSHFKQIKDSFKKKHKLAVLSPNSKEKHHAWLDKATSLLAKVLRFNFNPSFVHPYIVYAHRDLVTNLSFSHPEDSLTKAIIEGHEVKIFKTEGRELNVLSYFKIWLRLIIERIKISSEKIYFKIKKKIKK